MKRKEKTNLNEVIWLLNLTIKGNEISKSEIVKHHGMKEGLYSWFWKPTEIETTLIGGALLFRKISRFWIKLIWLNNGRKELRGGTKIMAIKNWRITGEIQCGKTFLSSKVKLVWICLIFLYCLYLEKKFKHYWRGIWSLKKLHIIRKWL